MEKMSFSVIHFHIIVLSCFYYLWNTGLETQFLKYIYANLAN